MTMTTVGYGDIVPATLPEILACVAAMTVGGFVFGMIVGDLAEVSKRANASALMQQEALSKVQMILLSGAARGVVQPELARQIKSHYSYQIERNTALDINAFILSLPPGLRDSMAESLHWIDGVHDGHQVFGLLHKIPFLSNLSSQATIKICAQMKNVYMDPRRYREGRQMIMEEGANGEEMYVIIEGSESVLVQKRGVDLGRLSVGDFFGELGALLSQRPDMAALRRRSRSAYAVTPTVLGMITGEDLMRFRRESMEINAKIVSYTNGIMENLWSASPGASPEVSSSTVGGAAPPQLSVLDPHPAVRLLVQKAEQVLSN